MNTEKTATRQPSSFILSLCGGHIEAFRKNVMRKQQAILQDSFSILAS
jgi:hypothetical protein